ncbi:nuclear factor 7, ovary-like isoform X2 [Centropristis striata]|uniref:nuclear factor 7, ovary-like isoform X2 n=1 Tax=Centropristis striata TaxID=184440 RepID=UPI0027E0C969|nr:nuclear factor 7, ovary-like isoform X2 [Centropristis striata]
MTNTFMVIFLTFHQYVITVVFFHPSCPQSVDMSAAASCLLTEDQFLCSICLDVFTDPVTIPCGHNFCKTCITKHWDINVPYQCPNCKKVFYTRPELQVNTFISEMAAHKEDADRETADGVQVFTALKESVERSQAELIDTIKEKQRKTEKQAEDFIKELEQEISELKKRSTEVEQLLQSEDHLHLPQSFTSVNAAPPIKDWTEVSVHISSYEGTVVRAVNQLEETLRKQMKKLLAEAELKRVQQSAVDLTLDPDTANPWLILSDDGKQVSCGNVKNNLPDNPERFTCYGNVFSKQSFSSGRFYHEVQVKGKTEWGLGVARESINRKGLITLAPQYGYWTILLRNENEYKALAGPAVRLSLQSRPEKVGVFVDYEEGLVSFYDVDAAALIYSFTGCFFTEKLYPYFSPCNNNAGKNSAPLVISPVNSTD